VFGDVLKSVKPKAFTIDGTSVWKIY
jgi:hypothetical protein